MTPVPSFAHLIALSDAVGTFEHAAGTAPRRSHGYCTDDVARVLVATSREPSPAPTVEALGDTAWRFLQAAQDSQGRIHNRRATAFAPGRPAPWQDRPSLADCWGRSVWAFGTAAAADVPRTDAVARFVRGASRRSPWPHAMAFAALGAAAVLNTPTTHKTAVAHPSARRLLADAASVIGRPRPDEGWPWPLPRLTYANAAIAEVLLAAGTLLDRPALVADGQDLLGWLVARETVDGHLSPTPVGGAGPGDAANGFDQQPIEVAAMADACARAAIVTGDPAWREVVERCVGWFSGANDVGAVMWDPATGGSYDGLHARGPNRNQGAESTIALLTTFQHARTTVGAAR